MFCNILGLFSAKFIWLTTQAVPCTSLQSAVLVNRGWVPRSWRDKSLQVQHDNRHESKPESHEIQETETTPWWKFWAKKPQASQVSFVINK